MRRVKYKGVAMKYGVLAALAAIVSVLVVASAKPSSGLAQGNVSVTVGGVSISDGGPYDSNPGANVIRFESDDPFWGFALPAGSSVSTARGTVDLGAALLPGPSVVRLTDLFTVKLTVAGTGALTISFDHTFAAPPAPALAQDAIAGSLLSPVLPYTVGGDTVSWQGFVNGVAIAPPAGAVVVTTPPPPVTGPVAVAGGHGPMPVPPPAGPPWTLRGDLSITLGVITTQFLLPDSAEVGIQSGVGTPTPPPGVGGIALVDSPGSPASSAGGSGSPAALYAGLAGGVAAAVVALMAGGWYARRRFAHRRIER